MQFTENNKGSTIMRATQGIEFKPLIKTLVERGAVGMIVAPAKAKKSMLALNLVFSLLTKRPFLGLPVSEEPEKIIYVNLELTKTALGVRLRAMNNFYHATPKQLDNVMFLDSEEFCNSEALVDTKTQKVNQEPFKALAEAAKDWGATVIIIDPLYYIVGEENDNMLMAAVIREFGKIRKAQGISIVVVHHTGKSAVDWVDPFLAGRGASSIGGAFEFVLGIEPKKDNEARLHHGSRNYASVNPFTIRFQSDTLTWHSTQEVSPDVQLDKLMGKDDEITLDEFYERAKQADLPKTRASNLLRGSANYERTEGYRGHKAKVRRKMRT
jgi:AAA domain